MASKVKIFGIAVSITWLAFITLGLWMKAVSTYFNDFITKNSLVILILTSILLLFFVITGVISIKSLTKIQNKLS
ncbi:MAG: hypothetical protein ACOCV1_00190 [Bacillota bacterium]